MNNIIVEGKQVVIFDTGNNGYDIELKDLVECFMKVKTSLFRNDAIKKGLINAEIEDIDYTMLAETITEFLGLNNVICCLLKDGEDITFTYVDNITMQTFYEKFVEYNDMKNKFYDGLNDFMMTSEYKGNVDINDEDLDDGLNIQISPANDDEWFKKYHEEFCDKFELQLMKAINVCNGGINYIYKLK